MGHVTGQSRYQSTLFPERLDELVPEDHSVRVIDAFVDGLDLARLGFLRVEAAQTGRPPYAPGDLLKLYVYGYVNQVRSSRRLERDTRRNIEVMWLIDRLTPSFKTIADFRKDHATGLVGVCRAFIVFCRTQGLFGAELLAIDGTKIAAVASRKKVITPQGIAKMTEAIDRRILAYLAQMDEADVSEPDANDAGRDVAGAVAALRARRGELQHQAEALVRDGLTQRVVGEEEARLMRTPRGHQVAYNAQIAVDAAHHLIAAFDLTNEGNDHQQLHPMAVQGKEAVAADRLTVVADAGYSNGEHGALCQAEDIVAIVPRAETVNTRGKQYFARSAFTYDVDKDTWRCPAGETLLWRRRSNANRENQYWTKACGGCALKTQCTNSKRRIITRHYDEDAREAMHRRAAEEPAWMKKRRQTAEHPFGTMKWLMGSPRFLVRGLKKAKAEFALTALGYNLKRIIAIRGTPAILNSLQSLPA
jgi:transposase